MKRAVKLLSLVLTVILTVSVCPFFHISVVAEKSDIYFYTVVEGDKSANQKDTIIITGIDSTNSEINVPEQIEGCNVTMIDGAFKRNKNIVSVILPNTVTVITADTFSYCSNLVSVTLPTNLKRIDRGAFRSCSSLKNISIPEGVTTIEPYAFLWCSSLESITIPQSLKYIAQETFSGCSSLKNIQIPQSVDYISSDAFSGTAYVSDESNWENGVLYMGCHLMSAKSDLSGRYSVKTGTKTITDYAFLGCTGLKEIVINAELKKIGRSAFSNCKSLTDVYYYGTVYDRRVIDIAENPYLTNAVWHYGYDPDVKEYTPGDINGDDKVNNKDLLRLFKYLTTENVEVVSSVVDVNGDKAVNNKDLIRLMQFISGWDVKVYSDSVNDDTIGDNQGPIVIF